MEINIIQNKKYKNQYKVMVNIEDRKNKHILYTTAIVFAHDESEVKTILPQFFKEGVVLHINDIVYLSTGWEDIE